MNIEDVKDIIGLKIESVRDLVKEIAWNHSHGVYKSYLRGLLLRGSRHAFKKIGLPFYYFPLFHFSKTIYTKRADGWIWKSKIVRGKRYVLSGYYPIPVHPHCGCYDTFKYANGIADVLRPTTRNGAFE